MAHTDLSHAIAVLLHPDRTAFEAEPRLRLFELARWTLLGGPYRRRKNESGIIYAAVEIACLGDDPISSMQRALDDDETRKLLQSTLGLFKFYHLLAADDNGLLPAMDKTSAASFNDAVSIADAKLSIQAAGARVSLENVLALIATPRGARPPTIVMRGHTSLRAAHSRYKTQLPFAKSLKMEPRPAGLIYEKKRLLHPQSLQSNLQAFLKSGRILNFLARAKTITSLIDQRLYKNLEDCWKHLPMVHNEHLNIANLSEEERSQLKDFYNYATEIRTAQRQKPPGYT